MDYNGAGSAYNPGIANTYTQVPPSVEESATRIRDAVGVTEQVLSALHDAIASLEKRLDTVVMPALPQATGNTNPGKPPMVPMSHLLGRIGILNEGFDHAVRRLRELTQRVEV